MGVVNLKIVAFAHQGAHHVLGHGSLLRAAGQHALQLLRAHLVVHLHALRLVAPALHASYVTGEILSVDGAAQT